jgi:hypothetical protein
MIRPVLTVFAVLVVSLSLAGCADKILSDDRIRDSTALALNLPAASVVISGRQYDGMMSTYYTASTRRGVYRCRISGGSVNMLGMTDPPDCARR